jgi:hypothetical protein
MSLVPSDLTGVAPLTAPSTLFAALAQAQGEMSGAAKDRQNPHFKAMYATMASVVDAIRGPLSRAGIAYIQHVSTAGRVVTVETVLLHGSGETLRCGSLVAEAKDPGPQAIGSVLTYLRRYSLMAAVGIAPEDDDGEEGTGRRDDRREEPRREERREEPRREEPKAKPPRTLASVFPDLDPALVDGWLLSLNRPLIAGMRDVEPLLAALATGTASRRKFDDWVAARADEASKVGELAGGK